MAAPNISELVATTIEYYARGGEFADNVSDNIALLWRLNKKGNVKLFPGGTKIRENLMYAENGASGFYAGYELLSVEEQEVLTGADFDLKQYYCNVVVSGEEMLKNSGSKETIQNLVESRISVAEKTARNDINASLFSDGTGSSGKEIGGLQLLVADTPTSGTVGGINRATWTFWRNKTFDFSDNSLTPGADTIQRAMNNLWINTVRGTDKPDFIVGDGVYYEYYLRSLQANQRFTNDEMAQAGFVNLKFMTADVTFDESCPASHMYFLNTDYLHYRPHRDRNFVLDKKRVPVNQDASVHPMFWAGNLTLSNASLQGVIKA